MTSIDKITGSQALVSVGLVPKELPTISAMNLDIVPRTSVVKQ